MRNKKNLSHLLKQFLKSSPRSLAEKRSSILPPEHRPNHRNLPPDQQYVRNFIVHVECSYMYNYYGPPKINQNKIYFHKKSFVNPLRVGLDRKNTIQINDKSIDKKLIFFELIKDLNKNKFNILKYQEMDEFLHKLSPEETRQYKKIIVYLYKWLLNEKNAFDHNFIHYELCQELSEVIIKKIYQSHEKGDYELLKNTEEELFIIQNLEKAREHKKNGQLQEAINTYETVYFGRMTDEADRMQALDYICERCKQQRNPQFLQKMIQRIKQGQGIRVHEKTILRAINEINSSAISGPVEQTMIPLVISQVSEVKDVAQIKSIEQIQKSMTEKKTGRGMRKTWYAGKLREDD